MDDRRLAELAKKQGGCVTTAQLLACGLTKSGIRHRVLSGRLFPGRRGVYRLSPHPDPRSDLWAAVLAVDPERAALSHWSAAHLLGMSRGRPSVVHVTVPGPGGRVGAGLNIHGTRSLPPADIVRIDGLPVTGAARTVLDVAARASDAVVGRLIREGEFLGLLRAGEMLRTLKAHPGHPGAARLRRVDPATVEAALGQTPLEDRLERLIRALPVPVPEPQETIRGISGTTYHVDFGWPDVRLAAEADGRSAHERASSLESDRFRDNDLAAVGWLVLRFTRTQLLLGAADAGRQIVATSADRSRVLAI